MKIEQKESGEAIERIEQSEQNEQSERIEHAFILEKTQPEEIELNLDARGEEEDERFSD